MVKPGYRQTEIGVIPEDWGISTLGAVSVGNLSYGINAPAVKYMPPLPNYIRITDITEDGCFDKENRASVDCTNPDKYLLHEGDVVLARTGASVGKSYLYNTNDGSLVYAGFLIRASIDSTLANPYYIVSSLRTKRYWDWVGLTSMRSGQPGINGKEYASYPLMIPSLTEQNKIAEALQDVDKQIAILEKLVAKKKAIKQGAMQELLTGKKRLAGFCEDWKSFEVENFVDFFDNLRIPMASSLSTIGNVPYYGANGIQDYVDGYTHNGEFVLLAEDGANDLRNYPVQYISGKAWVNNHAHVLCGKNGIADTRFLYYAFKMVDFQSILVGGTRAKLNGSVLKRMQLVLPPVDEQKAIAKILSHMDSEIESLEQKLAKARQLKQGMMQQLLTGKIRLV